MAWNQILVGDVREKLRELPDGIVQTCITSPPYWGLRDYGTAKWEGGSDPSCRHIADANKTKTFGNPAFNEGRPSREATKSDGYYFKSVCGKCGARRIDSQLGLEPTPEEYVANMVGVFREVRRVLRDDATLWLNLGDSYGAGGGTQVLQTKNASHGLAGYRQQTPGIKPKDLVGIPWRVAFALQSDGWYLRQDIIWAKPNPMPESVTDRCTKAHEYLFLMSKSARYYYDAEAINHPAKAVWDSRDMIDPPGANTKDAAAVAQGLRTRGGNTHHPAGPRNTANRRSVWTIATQPYAEAHFATFPEALVQPCILAGSKPGDLVLDPFMGAGTVALVAIKARREYIGCELNPQYAEMAEKRVAGEAAQERLL
jgi:DNA modification methylase